jgi:hypothetical protein
MAEYLLSTKNYKKLLLTDTNTSTDFILKYISVLNHPGFTRYSASENRKYTTKVSCLYKLVKDDEINIHEAGKNGNLELVKYMYNKGEGETPGYEGNEEGIDEAGKNGHLDVVKYLYNQDIKISEDGIDMSSGVGRLETLNYILNIRGTSGLKGSGDGIYHASKNGHLVTIKYLYSKGLIDEVCSVDSKDVNNHLEVVKYLGKKVLPSDEIEEEIKRLMDLISNEQL